MSKTQYEVTAATHQWVRAIAPGIPVNTVLVVESASLKEARNGPFWMLELKDATGSLSARVWSPLSQMFTDIPAGSLVAVEGRAERYREQIQCSVSALRVLDDNETAGVDASIFMPASARSPLVMLEELENMADAVFTHAPWRQFIHRVLRDEDIRPRLLKASAARGIHHARVGGLLEHTLGVARLCLHFVELYPQLDKQALLAGAICHDLGKVWELTSGLTTDYTDEGRLAGHIFLGLERLRPHMEAAELEEPLRLHLQHLVLSHHGQYEFGSPRLPQTAEALALHYADNVDAKMDQCRALFGDMEPQEAAWSPYQRSLERAMYRAPRTPENTADAVPDERALVQEPLEYASHAVPNDDLPPHDGTQNCSDEYAQEPQNDSQELHDFLLSETLPEDLPPYLDDDPGPRSDMDDDVLVGSSEEVCDENFVAFLEESCTPDTENDETEEASITFPEAEEVAFPTDAAVPFPTDAAVPFPTEDAVPVEESVSSSLATATATEEKPTEAPLAEEHPKTRKSRLEARQCSLL